MTPSKSNLPEPVLNLLGTDFPIDELPLEVKGLLSTFVRWEGDRQRLVDEIQKHDAALRSLSLEIATRVTMFKEELKNRPVDHAYEASM